MNNIKRFLIIFGVITVSIGLIALVIYFSSKKPGRNPILQEVKEGDVIEFGRYEQDNDINNGPEDIEWIVLESNEQSGVIVLLCKYCIDVLPLNDKVGEYYWADCSLRKWLNEDFYNTAFDKKEKERILRVRNENPDELLLKTAGGRNTTDCVFLLGQYDVRKYYPDYSFAIITLKGEKGKSHLITSDTQNPDALKATATEYAKEKYWKALEFPELYDRLETLYGKNVVGWWLKSPGTDSERLNAIDIAETGIADSAFANDSYGVRPVICISKNPKAPDEDMTTIVGDEKMMEAVKEKAEEEKSSAEIVEAKVKHYISDLQQSFVIDEMGTVTSFSYTYRPKTGSWRGVENIYTDFGLVLAIDENGKILCDNNEVSDYADSLQAQIDKVNNLVEQSGTVVKDIAILDESDQIYVLLETGELYCIEDTEISLFSDETNVKAISAMNSGIVFLNKDGTVTGKMNNFWIMNELAEWEDISEICTGEYFVAGLKSDGTVVARGAYVPAEYKGGPTVVDDFSDWTNIQSISAGYNHIVGLRKDGTVVAKGVNNYGQCDVSEWKNIKRIEASGNLSVAYDANGNALTVGEQIIIDYYTNINELGNCDIYKGYH